MSQKQPKAHKTIFNTTEKSNFILNMTNDQFNKFSSAALSTGIVLIFVFSLISELMSYSESYMTNDWRIFPSFGLAIAGIAGISIFIIALIKQTLSKQQVIASVAALIMLVCMYISYINAFTDIKDYSGFLGYRFGRYEGIMTYLSYLFIFVGAMSVNKKESVKKIFDTAVIVIILQCIWSGMQLIPSFPSHYHKTPYIINNVNLPSGVTGSPIFLSLVLAVGLSISMAGSVFEKSAKRKKLYCIPVFISSFFIILTHTSIGIISAALIIAVYVISFAMGKKKLKDNSPSFLPVIIMIAGCLSALAVMLLTNGIQILDGIIIWHDGFQRLNSFGQHSNSAVHLDDLPALYSYLSDGACKIINKYPLTGIGPDAFVLPDTTIMYDLPSVAANKYDRPYNEYLFYAATLGIPYCISFACTLIFSLICSARSAFRFIKGSGNWIHVAAFSGSLIYIVTAFINTGSAASTPFAWLLLGIGCCSVSDSKN